MRKLILVLNILVMMVCAVWGQSYVWDGEPAGSLEPIEGDEYVYHISTAAELAKLADLVNAGNDFAGMTVILQNDIFLNEGVLDEDGNLQNDGAGLNLWKPIGKNYDSSFQGTFDGNGKKVSGVYIVDDTRGAYLGLFGYLGEGGKIENVGVEDSYVKETFEYVCVGGVCGKSQGSILNSYNAGSVMGTGQGAYVGGVCGSSSGSGSISNSYNTGSVEGTGRNAKVGGVCGYSSNSSFTIFNSYNIGSVEGGKSAYVGGVCGYSYSLISNSYNAGLVEGGESAYVGGVCGRNDNSTAAGVSTITSCFYLAGTAKNGVGVGDGDDGVKPKELSTEFIGAVENWLEAIDTDPNPWEGEPGFEEGKLTLPNLKGGEPVIVYPPVPGLNENIYEIYRGDQLRWFATQVNGGATTIKGKLMQDIAVSGYTLDEGTPPALEDHWMPIGNFKNRFQGTFDGNGKKVLGVYIDNSNDDAYLGLFGCLGEGGRIENVGVEDSYVKGTGGQASIGGVCGYSFGSILNSYNAGSVKRGEVIDVETDFPKVGGVCGCSEGLILSSYNAGSVEGVGSVISVGGVCGDSFGSISNSYNVGSVKGIGEYADVGGVCGGNSINGTGSSGSILNSYNAGSVEGIGEDVEVGGVCGSSGGSIANSYNTTSVTGGDGASVGGVCGYNHDEEKITDCYYLAGTATSGIGDDIDSGNEKAAPKTAKELAEVMAEKLNGDPWTGSANYESGTLTLPYFEGCEPPTVELVPVEVADAIDFENEEVKDNAGYEVATDLSFNPLLLGKITLDDNSTIYVRNETVDEGEISDVIALSRPATPTLSADEDKTTATSITLKATTDIEGRDIEYGKENTDETPTITWQSSPTFGDLTPEIEYTFYARIQATESDFASLSSKVDVRTKEGYDITIDAGITNGTVKTDKTIASKGEIVTLTVTPDEDYELETLNVTGTNVSGSGNERTFEMPGEAVTVTATFKDVKPAPAPDPTPDPDPVYYTVTIPCEITGAIIHGGGTHQVREGSYIDFSIEIDPAGTGEYPTVTVDGYWWNTLRPDTRGNYRVYVYDDDCDIRIGEVSGYGTYTLTLPADSLFEGDDLYRSGVGIAVTPASSSPSSDALRYPFGTELSLTAVSDRHRAFVEWMDGSRRSPLTFRLREDTEAYAWFRALHPVGNEEIAAASIRIRTERGGSIVIDTPTRLPIAIYVLSGQCLRRSESEGTTRFSGLREGSCLVVVGTHSEVVIVR